MEEDPDDALVGWDLDCPSHRTRYAYFQEQVALEPLVDDSMTLPVEGL